MTPALRSSRLPLLRSPPFAGIAPSVAAVSTIARDHEPAAMSAAAIDLLFDTIRIARIGGTFWASPAEIGVSTAVVRVQVAADIATWADRIPEDALWLLPKRRWSPAAARRLRRLGRSVAIGDVDPWSLLASGCGLYAHGDDEWVALAHIAEVPTTLMSDGAFGSIDGSSGDRRLRVAAACLHVAYRDPFTDAPCPIDRAVGLLADWRAIIAANHGIVVAAGIARWKRGEIGRFLFAPRPTPLRYVSLPAPAVAIAARQGGGIAIWPSRVSPALLDRAEHTGVPLIRLEDGFVRSVGLGSNLFPPFSITVDKRGIHYDPSGPSDLEHLLEHAAFPETLLARAETLRRFIIAANISKYGSSGSHAFPPRDRQPRLVLVPGQVEDDMSVLCGGGDVTGNLDLLRRARLAEPNAEIWFRPHPDIDAGHRRGAVADGEARRYADRVVRGGGMAPLLDIVDGVHVLTSLTGFEALLRGRDVTTHGAPFYAGWGLTRDLGGIPDRRTRRLSLLELVAGVLILYPRYLDPETGLPCPPEVLLGRMAHQHHPKRTWLTELRALQGRFMRARRSQP